MCLVQNHSALTILSTFCPWIAPEMYYIQELIFLGAVTLSRTSLAFAWEEVRFRLVFRSPISFGAGQARPGQAAGFADGAAPRQEKKARRVNLNYGGEKVEFDTHQRRSFLLAKLIIRSRVRPG